MGSHLGIFEVERPYGLQGVLPFCSTTSHASGLTFFSTPFVCLQPSNHNLVNKKLGFFHRAFWLAGDIEVLGIQRGLSRRSGAISTLPARSKHASLALVDASLALVAGGLGHAESMQSSTLKEESCTRAGTMQSKIQVAWLARPRCQRRALRRLQRKPRQRQRPSLGHRCSSSRVLFESLPLQGRRRADKFSRSAF